MKIYKWFDIVTLESKVIESELTFAKDVEKTKEFIEWSTGRIVKRIIL